MAGRFVWHEILATDTEAARAFYCDVVGWAARDSGVPGVDYTVLAMGDLRMAGLMRQPEGAGPPRWLGYVAVDDVDDTAGRAVALGGGVLMPPHDIPGVGRCAVITDPQGAAIAMFSGLGDAPLAPPMAAGSIGWNELSATDMPAVWGFYETLFGWRKDTAMDMGPMGTYQIFAAGAAVLGGMMTRPPGAPGPHWVYYIAVPDIDAAVARATVGGASVLMGPMEVPGGAWVIQATDPQGVLFALVGQRAG